MRKFLCFIGWHSWTYIVPVENGRLIIPKEIPDEAICTYCHIGYGKKNPYYKSLLTKK